MLGSVQTTSHSCTYNVLSFDLDLIAYQVKVLCMTGGTLCLRLSLNHITRLHILFDICVLTMTSADFSQGHTQYQISLSFRVHVLYNP